MDLGIKQLKSAMEDNKEFLYENASEFNKIFIWLAGYIRAVASSDAIDKKGDDLILPFEKSINIAISLFDMIDKGDRGIDDQMAEDLKKLKQKYFGIMC